MINTILSKVVPDAGILAAQAQDTPEALAAHVELERERLRDEHKERDAAQAEVTEREAVIERIEALIAQADIAESELKDAEDASAAFTKAWAQAGADPTKPRTDPALIEKAHAAHKAAISARIASDGAEAGLPAARQNLHAAQNRLDTANDSIRQAVSSVLIAEAEPDFVAIAQYMEACKPHANNLMALVKALAGSWHAHSNDAAAAEVLNRLVGVMPAPVSQDRKALIHKAPPEITEAAAMIGERAKKLMEDSDAK